MQNVTLFLYLCHPSILLSKLFIPACTAGSECQFIKMITAVKCACIQMSLLSVCICVSRPGSVDPAWPQSSFTGLALSAETPPCLPAVKPKIHHPPGKFGFVQHLLSLVQILLSVFLLTL